MMKRLSDRDRARVQGVINRNRPRLARIRGYVDAVPGFAIDKGQLVRKPAIVVLVRQKLPEASLSVEEAAPRQIGRLRVDVQTADLETQIAAVGAAALGLATRAAAAKAPTYKPLPGNPIDAVLSIDSPFLCHAGPDTGWVLLRDFIASAKRSLVAAIYDFNADYIEKTLISTAKKRGGKMKVKLTIDNGLSNDETAIQKRLKKALKAGYDPQIVTCAGGARFPTAYHEKVIVRDDLGVWLSSGNWTKNSQPMRDPVGDPPSAKGMYSAGNREWHVIVEDKALASVFKEYIEHDHKQAKQDAALGLAVTVMPDVFVPVESLVEPLATAVPTPVAAASLPKRPRRVKVRPLISPDNYARRVDELIRSAEARLYLQYSYITWTEAKKDEKFTSILNYLGELSWKKKFDLKVIVHSRDAATKVRILAEHGWNEKVVHRQGNIHNKGIIVDGSKVMISSQNWSGDGYLRNRDAGLIIEDREVASYYERIFLDDWNKRTQPALAEASAAILALPGEAVPRGMVRMSWQDFHRE